MATAKFCSKCGKEVPAGSKAKFCLKCGAKIDLPQETSPVARATDAILADTSGAVQSLGPVTCPTCKMGNPVGASTCARCKATLRPDLIELALRTLPVYAAGPASRQSVSSCPKCGAMLASTLEWCTNCGSTI